MDGIESRPIIRVENKSITRELDVVSVESPLSIKILDKKGIINVGGPSQTIFKFAKKSKKRVKKIFSKGEFPKRTDMNLEKLRKIIKL